MKIFGCESLIKTSRKVYKKTKKSYIMSRPIQSFGVDKYQNDEMLARGLIRYIFFFIATFQLFLIPMWISRALIKTKCDDERREMCAREREV